MFLRLTPRRSPSYRIFELQRRLPGSIACDPEHLGFGLHRMLPPALRTNFQDLQAWRSGAREILDLVSGNHEGPVIVPMTLIYSRYFTQIIGGLRDDGTMFATSRCWPSGPRCCGGSAGAGSASGSNGSAGRWTGSMSAWPGCMSPSSPITSLQTSRQCPKSPTRSPGSLHCHRSGHRWTGTGIAAPLRDDPSAHPIDHAKINGKHTPPRPRTLPDVADRATLPTRH